MTMNKKAFTVDVDDDLSERFSKQVLERGFTKYRAVEGALRSWLALNPSEQVELMKSKGKKKKP